MHAAELLQGHYRDLKVIRYDGSMPCPPAMVQQAHRECDVVIGSTREFTFVDGAAQLDYARVNSTTTDDWVWDSNGNQTKWQVNVGGTWQDQLTFAYDTRDFTTYITTPQGDLLGFKRGSGVYWYLKDALGSVVAVMDSSGTLVNTYQYDPFGIILSESEAVPQPFKFASAYYDSETGLYKMGARYYDPNVGRFTQPDLVGINPYDPLSWDPYAYAGNSPINWVDPTGLHHRVRDAWRWVGEQWNKPKVRGWTYISLGGSAVLLGTMGVVVGMLPPNPVTIGLGFSLIYVGSNVAYCGYQIIHEDDTEIVCKPLGP